MYFQKLEENQDETNEDPSWADTKVLKRQFQGLKDIQFRPGKKFWSNLTEYNKIDPFCYCNIVYKNTID